jgi:hypothetical protein
VEWISFGRPSTLGLISGAIAGLVGITPASGTAGVLGALCIGGVTGVATFFASTKLKEAIDAYDDALDAFGLHAIGGITGALLTGVWCAPALGGVGFGTLVRKGGRETRIENIGFQLGIQACSIAFALAWVSLGTLLALKATDVAHGGRNWGLRLRAIRVSAEVEAVGLDEAQFAEQARLARFASSMLQCTQHGAALASMAQLAQQGSAHQARCTARLFAGLQLHAVRPAHLRRGALLRAGTLLPCCLEVANERRSSRHYAGRAAPRPPRPRAAALRHGRQRHAAPRVAPRKRGRARRPRGKAPV